MAAGGPGGGLRVLHVLEALRGGTSRHLADVVRNTPGVVHHVAVPAPGHSAQASGAVVDTPALATIERVGATVHYVDMRRSPAHPANLRAVPALRRLVSTVHPHVLHGHSAVGGALARMACPGRATPVVYTPNGLPEGRAAFAIERALRRWTGRLVAVSDSEGWRAIELGLVPPARLAVVPNGIEVSPLPDPGIDLRGLAGVPAGAPLVGTVARLVPQKAPELFVATCREIAARRPDVHFLLIGMGPQQEMVDAAVEQAGIGHRWHQIPHLDDASTVLGQLDVFVLASAFEGGPYTPLEAMRAGTPVVLTDVVGNRDVVEHRVSGYLAPFGDSGALAAHVVALLADDELRVKIVEQASRRLVERFDVRSMGAALEVLYREVAGLPPAPTARGAALRRPDPAVVSPSLTALE